jgi:DNA-binding MarR family transcriptional regulator
MTKNIRTETSAAGAASKIDQVLDALRRSEGATTAELMAITGWLSHTTRAALTRLRQKGHVLEKGKRDDATCYMIRKVA